MPFRVSFTVRAPPPVSTRWVEPTDTAFFARFEFSLAATPIGLAPAPTVEPGPNTKAAPDGRCRVRTENRGGSRYADCRHSRGIPRIGRRDLNRRDELLGSVQTSGPVLSENVKPSRSSERRACHSPVSPSSTRSSSETLAISSSPTTRPRTPSASCSSVTPKSSDPSGDPSGGNWSDAGIRSFPSRML